MSKIVEQYKPDLSRIYQAYALDACSPEEIKYNLLDFIQHRQQEFDALFARFFYPNPENFTRELQRNVLSKTRRMKKLEQSRGQLPEYDILANLECALKSAFYMHIRHLYNRITEYDMSPGVAAAIFFFVRENAYASMFRYNRRGEFNVPYGGISYNRKDLARKVAYLQSPTVQLQFRNTIIENMDFEAFNQKILFFSIRPTIASLAPIHKMSSTKKTRSAWPITLSSAARQSSCSSLKTLPPSSTCIVTRASISAPSIKNTW